VAVWLVVWLSGNALASINVVALRQTRLVPGWMTVCGRGKPSRYVTSQLGRLSLLPSVGRKNEYQLSGWVIIINADGGFIFWQPVQADSQPKSSGLVLGRRPLGAVLHSSNEPRELLQWLCHDDSTINIVLVIIIIIIIIDHSCKTKTVITPFHALCFVLYSAAAEVRTFWDNQDNNIRSVDVPFTLNGTLAPIKVGGRGPRLAHWRQSRWEVVGHACK